MKKMFILASLALVGMACSKNDDNVGVYNGGGDKVISNSTISGACSIPNSERRN